MSACATTLLSLASIAALAAMLAVVFLLARRKSIMQRRAAEREARERDAFMRAYPDYIFILDREGRFTKHFAPTASGDRFLGGIEGGIDGKRATDLFNPDSVARLLSAIGEAVSSRETREVELSRDTAEGRRAVEFRIVPVDRDSVLCVARDVTERVLHEESLVAHLAEKEVLIREIHHRVKNNLQVMSSLIALQTELFRDEADKLLMRETERRIHTMAYLHNLVYRSQDCSSIDLGEYVAEIVRNLRIALGVRPEQVAVTLDIEGVRVQPETALPVGLIVNELVSNSFKFAFPGSRAGTVSASIALIGDEATLTVRDDGCGLPEGFAPATAKSLGWILINSLSRQIGGTIELLPGPGTGVKLAFSLAPRN